MYVRYSTKSGIDEALASSYCMPEMSARSLLFQRKAITVFAEECVDWTNLLCLFLSGSVIATQRVSEGVSEWLKRLLLWLPCHIHTLPPAMPFTAVLALMWVEQTKTQEMEIELVRRSEDT